MFECYLNLEEFYGSASKHKMKYTVYDRLLRRELGLRKSYCNIAGIYGDKKFIDDLDIINELGSHSGCVNALWYATEK